MINGIKGNYIKGMSIDDLYRQHNIQAITFDYGASSMRVYSPSVGEVKEISFTQDVMLLYGYHKDKKFTSITVTEALLIAITQHHFMVRYKYQTVRESDKKRYFHDLLHSG